MVSTQRLLGLKRKRKSDLCKKKIMYSNTRHPVTLHIPPLKGLHYKAPKISPK